MYKSQVKGDVALIYNLVLCLHYKETENVHRNCGFVLYRHSQQSVTFNTLLDAVEQSMPDCCRNVGNPKSQIAAVVVGTRSSIQSSVNSEKMFAWIAVSFGSDPIS